MSGHVLAGLPRMQSERLENTRRWFKTSFVGVFRVLPTFHTWSLEICSSTLYIGKVLLSLFDIWENDSSERPSHLCKVTQLVGSGLTFEASSDSSVLHCGPTHFEHTSPRWHQQWLTFVEHVRCGGHCSKGFKWTVHFSPHLNICGALGSVETQRSASSCLAQGHSPKTHPFPHPFHPGLPRGFFCFVLCGFVYIQIWITFVGRIFNMPAYNLMCSLIGLEAGAWVPQSR